MKATAGQRMVVDTNDRPFEASDLYRQTVQPMARRLELWGGVECTINRVGDQYFNQLRLTGHDRRIDDLDAIASIGIRTLRYPVLWEQVAFDGLERACWDWPDKRLTRLRALNIEPIVGLLHHGSGPPQTNLLDPEFSKLFAAYARALAERYPWISMYTPVNEPLTTARFSALYGAWYPHERDNLKFARALVNQCRAVVLAMREIRAVNSRAMLVQTDDLGKVFSTPALAYQADFENERRWLTFDLLCGRVTKDHPMWGFLTYAGLPEAELNWFLDHPCPPNIFGFNHYITSERFLDDRRHLYPPALHGGNGRHQYADVEAVRVRCDGIAGPYALLKEAWERYRQPMAVTEMHLHCTVEDRLRWGAEVWHAANALQSEGADIRAVTAWALVGSFDWSCLVRECRGEYEPGAFAVVEGRLEPTRLIDLLRCFASGEDPGMVELSSPGWWRQPQRLLYDCADSI